LGFFFTPELLNFHRRKCYIDVSKTNTQVKFFQRRTGKKFPGAGGRKFFAVVAVRSFGFSEKNLLK